MIQAKQTLGRYESVKKNNTVPKFLFYFTTSCLYGMSPIYIYRKKKVKHNHFSLYTPPPLKNDNYQIKRISNECFKKEN